MARAELKNETYHLVFHIGDQKYSRSLKTKSQKEALARKLRIEENLTLVQSGRLEVPENADLVTFLLSDGKLNKPVKKQKRLRLGKLFATFKADLPKGSLEANSLSTAEIHMRHIVRSLGTQLELRNISTEHLQRHINTRSKHPGRHGRDLSAGTIKKEIATLVLYGRGRRTTTTLLMRFPIMASDTLRFVGEIEPLCRSGLLRLSYPTRQYPR